MIDAEVAKMSCDLCIFVRRIDLLKQAIRPGVLQKSRCIWSQDVVKRWTWQASCPPFFCVHHLLSSPNSMASLRPRDMSALTCTWMIYDQPLEKMWTWGGIMYFRRFTHGSSIRGMWRCRMKKIVFFYVIGENCATSWSLTSWATAGQTSAPVRALSHG